MDNKRFFPRLRKRLATNSPGLTVGVIAMLIALTGGAFAASGALSPKQKKEVKAIVKAEVKKFPGPAGPAGPAGPQGLTGAAGAAGAKGDQGAEGKKGADGAPGKDGKSVEVTPIATGNAFECEKNGGALVKEEGALSGIEVCTGEKGEKGEKGEPWTLNGTLPPGATEAGTWAFNGTETDTSGIRVPISFSVKFPFVIEPEHVHFGLAEEGGAFTAETGACPAKSSFNPKAAPGELCIYKSLEEGLVNATFDGVFKQNTNVEGATPSGALLKFTPTGVAYGAGSWAVTGCKTPRDPSECPA